MSVFWLHYPRVGGSWPPAFKSKLHTNSPSGPWSRTIQFFNSCLHGSGRVKNPADLFYWRRLENQCWATYLSLKKCWDLALIDGGFGSFGSRWWRRTTVVSLLIDCVSLQHTLSVWVRSDLSLQSLNLLPPQLTLVLMCAADLDETRHLFTGMCSDSQRIKNNVNHQATKREFGLFITVQNFGLLKFKI